jgi:hypothetical protein
MHKEYQKPVFLVPYNSTDEEIKTLSEQLGMECVRVEMVKPYYNPKPKKHWRDNLIKNGVKV